MDSGSFGLLEIEKLNGRHPIDLANIKYDDKVYVVGFEGILDNTL